MKRWWKQSHVKSSQTFWRRYHTMNLHLIRFRPCVFFSSTLYIWIKWSILYNEIQANCVIYTIFVAGAVAVAVEVPQAVYRLWHTPLSDDEIRYLHYCDYFTFICLFRHRLLSCSFAHRHTQKHIVYLCNAVICRKTRQKKYNAITKAASVTHTLTHTERNTNRNEPCTNRKIYYIIANN